MHMYNEILFDIITLIAGAMTLHSFFFSLLTLIKYIKNIKNIKKTKIKIKLLHNSKLEMQLNHELNKQLSDLKAIKKEIETEEKKADDKSEYEELKMIINSLIEQYSIKQFKTK